MQKMSSVLLIFSKMTTIFAEIRRCSEISSIFPSPQNLKKRRHLDLWEGKCPSSSMHTPMQQKMKNFIHHTHVLFMFADINVHCTVHCTSILRFSVSNKNLRLFFCVMALSGNGSFVREPVYDVFLICKQTVLEWIA